MENISINDMKIIKAVSLDIGQKRQIINLWNEEYPVKLRFSEPADFDHYLDNLANKEHFLLVDDWGKIWGWAMLFDRDGERWFAIIIYAEVQGKGYGTQMLNVIKGSGSKLNGWVTDHDRDMKANGLPYRSPLEFYMKNGFTVRPEIRLELEKISAVKIEWGLMNNE